MVPAAPIPQRLASQVSRCLDQSFVTALLIQDSPFRAVAVVSRQHDLSAAPPSEFPALAVPSKVRVENRSHNQLIGLASGLIASIAWRLLRHHETRAANCHPKSCGFPRANGPDSATPA